MDDYTEKWKTLEAQIAQHIGPMVSAKKLAGLKEVSPAEVHRAVRDGDLTPDAYTDDGAPRFTAGEAARWLLGLEPDDDEEDDDVIDEDGDDDDLDDEDDDDSRPVELVVLPTRRRR